MTAESPTAAAARLTRHRAGGERRLSGALAEVVLDGGRAVVQHPVTVLAA
jgi:hypothetical protein